MALTSGQRLPLRLEEPMAVTTNGNGSSTSGPPSLDELERQKLCLKNCGERFLTVENFWTNAVIKNQVPVELAQVELNKAVIGHTVCMAKCVPQRRIFTDADKRDVSNGTTATMWGGGLGIIIGLGTAFLFEQPELAVIPAVIAGGFIGAGVVFAALANDPDDPNFAELPVPSFPKLPTVRPVRNTRVTAPVAAAANAITANQAQAIGLVNALQTALNRANSAADAGDDAAEAKQVKAAKGFATQVVKVMRDAASLRLTLAGLWTGALDVIIPVADAETLRNDALINGLPKPFLDTLTTLGFDQQAQDDIRQDLIGQLADLSAFPQFRFRDLLTAAKVRAAEVGVISVLEHYSRS
jgi:hypothetical protein